MHRRRREAREVAGWQCAAGRAILRMEASQFAPLAGTTKNTILRFESGQFMPRRETVGEIERAFRERGIFPIFTKDGDPRGITIGWQAYGFAYPEYEVQHRRVEEIAARQRQNPPPLEARPWPTMNRGKSPKPRRKPAKAGVAYEAVEVAEAPRGARGIEELEAEQRRLMAELERLKALGDDDEHDF